MEALILQALIDVAVQVAAGLVLALVITWARKQE
jgi:hypothetical protein